MTARQVPLVACAIFGAILLARESRLDGWTITRDEHAAPVAKGWRLPAPTKTWGCHVRGWRPMYGIPHPRNNHGPDQVCEKDHLIPLELCGADTIANVWPECTPGYAGWDGPGFRDEETCREPLTT
jgi:hypothetical protein